MVTNDHASNDYFVPTKTAAEWNAFNSNQPSGITVGNCNYFGSGSDGDVTYSSSTNLACTLDSDMKVMNYDSLTINSGVTLTTDNRCKGLFIYVKGNATINGTLSMTARGASVDPVSAGVSATGLRLPMLKSGETDTLAAADFAGAGSAVISAVGNQPGISGNGKIYTIARAGAAGGSRSCEGTGGGGSSGAGQSGGGGGAGGGSGQCGGYGAAGTVFSGGSGGANANRDGAANGGAGGSATEERSGGGAGNPGGSGGGNNGTAGASGTGGLLILVVGGDLTIGGSGSIAANGSVGGNSVPCDGCDYSFVDGAGSGGGNILVLHAGSLSNSGSIAASGGSSGGGGYYGSGSGGAGSVQTDQVD